MAAMRALDLFSGIGGFSLGLRPLVKTVAYCDSDPACRAVIAQNVVKGALRRAPIYDDVSVLKPSTLSAMRPEFVMAGFPCQDISCLLPPGHAAGVHGLRSKLFFDMMRLVKQLPTVQHVLLENSPCILHRGATDVLKALQAAGFRHVAHGIFSAKDVGALHVRKRWYCLASRAPEQLRTLSISELRAQFRKHRWVGSGIPRLVPRPADAARHLAIRQQCSLLGNAVVPQTVLLAYHILAHTLQHAATLTPQRRKQALQAVIVYNGRTYVKPAALTSLPPQNSVTLKLTDDTGRTVVRQHYRTPTHGLDSWNQCRTMTDRALWNAGNVIYFEATSSCPASPTVSDRSRHCTINPRFIEQLMGYPVAWTHARPGAPRCQLSRM